MNSYAIGQLASAAGVGIDTVRYYERSGLLRPATRSASGYRKYGEGELDRLNFIRRAQHLGFSLTEIGDLLAISSRGDVAAMHQAAKVRLTDIDKRIAELQRVRDALTSLMSRCPREGTELSCPILRALLNKETSQ
ncbi:MAG: MerR family transcriptional regulator [Dokdonella sp.]|uniref:MerR family transcriptional regulator n=1 Tax=Dokdonella sp. TaxID=2291710 RepID=UPI002BC88DC8|nr:MerR family transcriptional regulator [Dokdonella sp.]HOX71466.1 MerR family DNA-binding protein [Dokdonella sp.]HPG94775.1 MerR family DNA-binding protein [Dokdonella sp.]HPN79274.1 MerR family DNA-binding protein [Dokdonella sp.]